MKGVTRYVRLPVGVNNKLKYEEDFPHVLHTWEPLRRYSVRAFCELWDIDLDVLINRSERKKKRYNRSKGAEGGLSKDILDEIKAEEDPVLNELMEQGRLVEDYGDGKYEVRCPFEDEHTVGGGGTAYFRWGTSLDGESNPYGGFKCHHGHCEQRPTREYWERLIEESDGRLEWGSINNVLADFEDLSEFDFGDGDGGLESSPVEDFDPEDLLGGYENEDTSVTATEKVTSLDMVDLIPAGMTKEDMLDHFVFVTNGSRVLDMRNSQRVEPLSLPDWTNSMAPHSEEIEVDGEVKRVKSSKLWFNSEERSSVHDIIYRPGKGRLFHEEGIAYANRFCFPNHPVVQGESSNAVTLILDHMKYLCGGDVDDCYELHNWVAHKIQRPSERSMSTPLLLSEAHGTGKSFFGKLLRSLFGSWNVQSAKMKDLMGQGADFNGYLVNSLLVIVDEVRDKGDKQPWSVNDRLRDTLTEDHLLINIKGGSQGSQRVYCNFLMMSNHPNDALRMDAEDRRIHAIHNSGRAKGEEYYQSLHRLLDNKVAVGEIFHYFLNVDLSTYNRAAPAAKNAARDRLVDMALSHAGEIVSDMIEDKAIPDLITIRHVREYAKSYSTEKITERELIAALRDLNCLRLNKRVRFNRHNERPWCIRNMEKWRDSTVGQCKPVLKNADRHFNMTEFENHDDFND